MKKKEPQSAEEKTVVSAAKWGAAGTLARIAVQIVAQLILVRLLGPEAFGVYAVGAITLGLAAFLVDMGVGPALVQKQELSDADIRYAFTLQLMIGISISVLLFSFSPWIARVLNQPDSTPILRVLSVVCLISAASSVSQNILRRRLDFKSLHLGQVSSFVFGYFLCGVVLAFMDYGVWAIVASVVMQNFFFAVWVVRVSAHPKSLMFVHPEGAQSILRFGTKAFLTNLLNWAISNIDRLVVARFFPGHGLGIYNTTYNLILAPTGQVLGVLQSILFPASARSQADRKKLLAVCRAGLSVGSIVIVPVFTAISVMASEIVSILYGEAWSSAAPVLSAISVAMIPYCLMGILTPVLWGVGKVEVEGRVQVVSIFVLIVLAVVASSVSYAAVAWAVAVAFVFRFFAILYAFCSEFEVAFWLMLKEVLTGFILGFCASAFVLSVLAFSEVRNIGVPFLKIFIELILFVIGGILALPFVFRTISFDGAGLLLRVVGKYRFRAAAMLTRELTKIQSSKANI